MTLWINLAAGSLLGGFSRYFMGGLVAKTFGASFPHGTLAVNLTGCFLIGILDTLAEEKFHIGPNARMLLMVGFCGAFTTFSTLILETSHLMKDGEMLRAFANLAISIVLGLLLLRLGGYLGKLI